MLQPTQMGVYARKSEFLFIYSDCVYKITQSKYAGSRSQHTSTNYFYCSIQLPVVLLQYSAACSLTQMLVTFLLAEPVGYCSFYVTFICGLFNDAGNRSGDILPTHHELIPAGCKRP
jgi:hypothetical protein